MSMVTTPNFSVMVNGDPATTFLHILGLRKGDPLSPFLFVLAMEGLNKTIKEEVDASGIKGLQPQEECKPTTHQRFLDDILLHKCPL